MMNTGTFCTYEYWQVRTVLVQYKYTGGVYKYGYRTYNKYVLSTYEYGTVTLATVQVRLRVLYVLYVRSG